MIDKNLARGIFVLLLAILFGVPAVLHYPIGNFARGGPGLFPTMVSCILGLIGIAMIVRSRFTKPERLEINLKNIGIIVGSLVAFAVVSEHVNMIAGIVLMVFIAALAGTNYSWWRNVKVAAVLVLFAFGFQRLLGLNLPLY
ncbi:MAG: tripartite tricarboxylate transporter TctB family protein [Rhodocyclaceae bacterium]|nr:tripartite tricarboxylate transporter TctB family protein [Pseudomonadota bacterium]MDQ7972409.1 tripartite tricarboxylate transporter TctB family protein [Rhodocyclaceae bacterium]MDQ7998467.1 tripartite tricarboxylate transporter TctB family protein [Pseudomonadota bacterium]MDQ8016328.1 tripartite tricarboxylate transporter TctB family protein [Pseudomonadota bacterium]